MKNTIIIHKKIISTLIICLIKTAICFAQPVIKVPIDCEVVVAGTGLGTSTGFGGVVGNGGIIIMPDPFDFPKEEGDFFYVSNDYELIRWELLGDLSMQTETYYNEVLQPIGAINPVNIQSYNKKLRFGEMPSNELPNLDVKWARSKGRVIVSYFDKRCIGNIKFDVYKRYKKDGEKNLVPPILGPDCVLPNTSYTFSVDPISSDNPNNEIGFDNYYWSGLPEDCILLYSSPDNSTITIKTGESVTSFIIQCCYGRANDWDGNSLSPSHTTCASKPILGTPSAPQYVVNPPSCHPTGVPSFTIVYPNTSNTYTWTSTNTGWTIGVPSVGPTNTSVTVTTPNNNPGDLQLTITSNACVPSIFNYQINRSFAAPLTVIPTGATTTCIAGTSSGNTYTISPNATGNSVVWTTNPASIVGVTLVNANTPIVTVNTSGAAAGSFTLIATSGTATCSGSNVSLSINLKPESPAFTVTTPNCVIKGVTPVTTIGVIPVPGASSYTWTYPTGVTCTTNCTTANPTFTLNSAGTSAVITCTANGTSGCISNQVSKTINYLSIATNFPIGGFADQYAVNSACGIVTSWVVNGTTYTTSSGNVGISGANNNILSISGTGGSPITQVCANVSGIGQVCATSFGSNTLKQTSNPKENNNVIISPNPNDGNFTIQLNAVTESATATLIDFTGKSLDTFILIKGENKIKTKNLACGTYIVILDIDGKKESQRIIVK